MLLMNILNQVNNMAHSYTPGLKVLKNTKILKERRLPLKGSVDTSVGDTVEPGDIIAKTDLPGNVQMVNIANQLNVDASDVETVMITNEGSKVCLLYTSPSPRDRQKSRMPSSA